MKHRIFYGEAEQLAEETIRQMSILGYKGIQIHPLIEAIQTADVRALDTRRRQYSISKNPIYTQTIEGPDERVCLFMPRRVVSTNPEDAQPRTWLEKMVLSAENIGKAIEEFVYQYKNDGFDSEVVVRKARKDAVIGKVSRRAYKQGINYALMGTIINTSREDKETEEKHKKAGTPEMHIRHPWLAFPDPKITADEIYEISQFCKNYQIPSDAWLMNHVYSGR